MSATPLPVQERQELLAEVWGALRARDPTLFGKGLLSKPGGIAAIDAHLDALVDIARGMTADRVEPYLTRLLVGRRDARPLLCRSDQAEPVNRDQEDGGSYESHDKQVRTETKSQAI